MNNAESLSGVIPHPEQLTAGVEENHEVSIQYMVSADNALEGLR